MYNLIFSLYNYYCNYEENQKKANIYKLTAFNSMKCLIIFIVKIYNHQIIYNVLFIVFEYDNNKNLIKILC